MAKDPAFLFYTKDFVTGTQFLSDEQVGIYLRLLMAQHQHGHLSEKQVIFICKTNDKEVLSKFTKDADGFYYNERLEEEIFKRNAFTESRRNNKLGKKKQVKKTKKTYEKHMANANNTVFDVFYKEYPRKEARKKGEEAWSKLTEEQRKLAINSLHWWFIGKKPEFYPLPATFLNGKRWEDDKPKVFIPQSTPDPF